MSAHPSTASTSRFEQAAVTLAEHGYHVFPCRSRGKEPITANGFRDSSRDEQRILHWWTNVSDANIGIDCGKTGIVVWDIDSKHGADPDDILAERDLHGAPIVLTGEAPERDQQHPNSLPGVRGAQVYFRGTLKTTGKLKIPGTEIRGAGGYVVAPPSVHPSGVEYVGDLPPVAMLPETPAWLLELIDTTPAAAAAAVTGRIAKGEQHSTLVSLAGSMRRRGMDADEIEAALLVTNAKRLQDPAPPEHIRRIAESVAKYPPTDAVNGAQAIEHGDERFALAYTEKGAVKLPKPAETDDRVGHCKWLTNVFSLDHAHPVISGAREGADKAAEGHVVLRRLDAPSIRFEPASRINTPARLSEDLSWQTLPSDGELISFRAEHCRKIARVIRMLCGIVATRDAAQETAGIVGSFLGVAVAVYGQTTYGDGRARYAAAEALRRSLNEEAREPTSPPRYLVDENTGEFVIPVDELQSVARKHVGSLGRGWLDARMDNLGWQRLTLDGHGLPGRDGRRLGMHIRRDVYRGLLLPAEQKGNHHAA